jgi:hypothetical protein
MPSGNKEQSVFDRLKAVIGDVLPEIAQRYAKDFIHAGLQKFVREVELDAEKPDLYKIGGKKTRIWWKTLMFGQTVVIGLGRWEEDSVRERAKKVGR